MSPKRGEMYVRSVNTQPKTERPTVPPRRGSCPRCHQSYQFATNGFGVLVQVCWCRDTVVISVHAPRPRGTKPVPQEPDDE